MFSIGWIGDCTKAKLSTKSPAAEGPSFRMLAVGLAEIAKNKWLQDHFNLRGAIQVGNKRRR
jgi:hypothetical protein